MKEILKRSDRRVLVASSAISCGKPADICTELELIDLNEFITDGKDGVYLIRANGDSMEHKIFRGDWMIVDRNLQANFGDAIVAFVNGDYVVKDYQPKRNGLCLVPKNKKYATIAVTAKDDYKTFGVVTGIVRSFKKI